MTRYVLPDLPDDYVALEPHTSGRIMRLHHDEHRRNNHPLQPAGRA